MQRQENEQSGTRYEHLDEARQQAQQDNQMLLHMHKSNSSSQSRLPVNQTPQHAHRLEATSNHQRDMLNGQRPEIYTSGTPMTPSVRQEHEDNANEQSQQRQKRPDTTSGNRTPKTMSQVLSKTGTQYGNGILKMTQSNQSRSGCVTTRTKYLSNCHKDKSSGHRTTAYETHAMAEQTRFRLQKEQQHHAHRKDSFVGGAASKQQTEHYNQQQKAYRSNETSTNMQQQSYSANRSNMPSKATFAPSSHKSSSVIGTTQNSSSQYIKYRESNHTLAKGNNGTAAHMHLKPKLAVVTNTETAGTSAGTSTALSTVSQAGGASGLMRRVDSSISVAGTSSHMNSKKYSTAVLRSSQLNGAPQKQHSENALGASRLNKPSSTCVSHRGNGPTVSSGPMGPLGLKQKKTASPISTMHQGNSSQQRMSHIIASNINYGLNSSNLRQTEFRVIHEMINGPSESFKKKTIKTCDVSPSRGQRTRSGGSQFSQQQQNSKSRKTNTQQQTRNVGGTQEYNPMTAGTMSNSSNVMKLEEQQMPLQQINSSRVHVPDRFSLYTRAQQPRVFPKSPSAVSIDAKATRDRKQSETEERIAQDQVRQQLQRQMSSSLYLNYKDAQNIRNNQGSRTFALNTVTQGTGQSHSSQQSRCGALASHRAHQRANPSIIQQPTYGLATSLETISEKRAQLQHNIKKQLEQTQQVSGVNSLNQSNSQTKRKFGQTQQFSSKTFSQAQNVTQSSIVNASNKNVKGISGSREKKKTFSNQAVAQRKQTFNTSALGVSFVNDQGCASGMHSSRVYPGDSDQYCTSAGLPKDQQDVSNKKQAKRRDFIQENKRVYTQQSKVLEDPKYSSQRLRQTSGLGGNREVLSSRITPSKQIFKKDKKKNSLSKSPSQQQIKQMNSRVPLRQENTHDSVKMAQTHRPDQISEILRSLNQSSQVMQQQTHASLNSKGEQAMTFAAAQMTRDADDKMRSESTNAGVGGGTFDMRQNYLQLQVAEEGSRSELQLRDGGCRGPGMSNTLFGSGVASQDQNLQPPQKRKDDVANILINSKQSAAQPPVANNLLQMTQSSSQTGRNVVVVSQRTQSAEKRGELKPQQVSFQAAQNSQQRESESSVQHRNQAGKQPVRSDKENQRLIEETDYHQQHQQQMQMTAMQQMAQAAVSSAPQSTRRVNNINKRDRKVKPEKKENCDALAQMLRQTVVEETIPKKNAEQKPQVQVKKEEQRQVLAPANLKQPKEPAAEPPKQETTDPLNDSMIFSQKSSLEDYIIGKQIGQGAYAVVRVGLNRQTNKKVAMKIYKKYKLEEPNRRKSVKREIKLMEKMKHHSIIQLYEIIDTGKYVILVMEYVSNGSLHGYLKSKPNRRLQEWDAKRIFKQIVEGLRYCHSKCIAHRDIKLENLLLDETNSMKIIDFGFSTCFPNDRKVKIFCGTPSYMAPEIVLKTEYCGPPADIWAMGVLLFTILSGQFPYRGATDEELYDKICRADYHLPKEVKESLSPAAKDLLAKLFSLKASDRPTAKEILEHQWLYHVSEKKEAAQQNHNDSICQIMPYENSSRPRAKSQKEAMAPKNKIVNPANQQKDQHVNPFFVEQKQENEMTINENVINLISAKLGYGADEVREQVILDLRKRAGKPQSEAGTSFVTNLYLRMLDDNSAEQKQPSSKSMATKYLVNQAMRGASARGSDLATAPMEVQHSEAKSLTRSANISQAGGNARFAQAANQTQQLMLKSALSQTSLGLSANGNMLSQGLGQNNMQNIGIQPSYVPSLKSLGSNGGPLAQTAGSSFQQHNFNNTLTTPFQASNLAAQAGMPASAGNSRLGAMSNFNNTQPINFATMKEGNNFFKDSVEDGGSSCRTRNQHTMHMNEASNGSQVKPEANMNILQMHQTNIFVNAGSNFPAGTQQQQEAFGFYPCAPASQENEAETMTDYDVADSTIMSKQSMTVNSRCAKSAGNQVRRKTNCWMTGDAAKQAIYEMESVSEEQVSPDFKQRVRVKSGMRV